MRSSVRDERSGGESRRDAVAAPMRGSAPAGDGAARDMGSRSDMLPGLTLPKGGGAVRGIGEKFTANPTTGSGGMSVPIALSPGRSGFGPQLALAYDSGGGNGPFGLGWHVDVPAITRKTDKGLPLYRDDEESDTFILSGAEDLVPALRAAGMGFERDVVPRVVGGVAYTVHRYRPRVEGIFARIERWRRDSNGETHWRAISGENITTIYGRTSESRIADPADPLRVFSWLVCERYDDKGNAIHYRYKAENDELVPTAALHERNRTTATRAANRYPKRILYGNRTPRVDGEDLALRTDWLFEVVFDYGEHYEEDGGGAPTRVSLSDAGHSWGLRADPFSTYRSGFEVRTYRLCRRVLMFHHFPAELGTNDCLVNATHIAYTEGPVVSFVSAATQSGYVRRDDGTYRKRSMPAVEFTYSEAVIDEEVREADAAAVEGLPEGIDGARYQFVDLDGEGLNGILSQQAGGWYYKRNLGALPGLGGAPEVRFGATELVSPLPALHDLGPGRQRLVDLDGDGRLDLAQFDRPLAGFYRRTEDAEWENFTPFESLPNIAFGDANLRFVDLTGDGRADVLITEEGAYTWYGSLGDDGFAEAARVRAELDEERGPRLVFADGEGAIYLADLSGDGLADLVRIRNGAVCYWPNLGYGRFGAKVTMQASPTFDAPGEFDHRRLRLADVDGSGPTDIIYLGRDDVRVYFNQSGNAWSAPRSLAHYPDADNLSSVTAADLLGTGTACLIWSSPLQHDSRAPLRYIDLMGTGHGRGKPHLLIGSVNNLGVETHVTYVPSTRFYLADRAAGRPWATRLPFPVHVVERVETYDRVSRNRFVTRNAYHHGYFDGPEREFRGFGMVERWDTEEYAALSASDAFPDAVNLDAASHVPPVLTRTWFHTGAYLRGATLERAYEAEYYNEYDPSLGTAPLSAADLRRMRLPDTVMPPGLSPEEERQAVRALKGAMLRQEVYALDGTDAEDRPYSVSERSYVVRPLQMQAMNRHAVFLTHARETLEFHYERKLYDVAGILRADPRVTHNVVLEIDDYGNVLRSAAIGYGRRFDEADHFLTPADRALQRRTHAEYTEAVYTTPIVLDDVHRVPVPCETRVYELLKTAPAAAVPFITNIFGFAELDAKTQQASDGAHDIPYEDVDGAGAVAAHPYRRLIEHTLTLYRRDDLNGPLAAGTNGNLGLPYESYRLAFTPALVTALYGTRVDDALLGGDGGYVHADGGSGWWIPSGRVHYSLNPADAPAAELANARNHFFLPRRAHDPFDNRHFVDFDAYDLLPVEARDALGNVTTTRTKDNLGADITAVDYRVLMPWMTVDPNGNRSAAAFDAFGRVSGMAAMGRHGETRGDSLDGFAADLDDATIAAYMADPFASGAALLKDATSRFVYDVHAYERTKGDAVPQPLAACAITRATHAADLPLGVSSEVFHTIEYGDGFGRALQTKAQAEAGPVVDGGPSVSPRWVGSGWTIYDNKGMEVKRYEPFFTATHHFEFARVEGVGSTTFYDPVGRPVGTLHPNHTFEKKAIDPWKTISYDANDTVLIADPTADPEVGPHFARLPNGAYLPTWYAARIGGVMGGAEKRAAEKAAAHANTPTVVVTDALGRTVLTIADAGGGTRYGTRTVLDAEGNQRAVIDAAGRTMAAFAYDMLGNVAHAVSMEAGERWTLKNVSGDMIRTWDALGRAVRTRYDALHRPTHVNVKVGAAAEFLAERMIYGEAVADASRNLRGHRHLHFDQAGVQTSARLDFKGNLLEGSRRVNIEYKGSTDWAALDAVGDPAAAIAAAAPALEAETFTAYTEYDALNRPVMLVTPHNATTLPNVLQPIYNSAQLLDKLDVWLRRPVAPTGPLDPATADLHAVTNIDYNASRSRARVELGSGVVTTYTYDRETFRLMRLRTRREVGFAADERDVQDLAYTYDPVGNITHIQDDADIHNVVFFRNRRVEPSTEYTYDPLYRLTQATGREHLGLTMGALDAPTQPGDSDFPRTGIAHRGDGDAVDVYTEAYTYDGVGNILELLHTASSGTWRRRYDYSEPSRIEPGLKSNRLSSTSLPGDVAAPYGAAYTYDAHGNVTRMPHLPLMVWDYRDQLHATSRQVAGGGATPETTYYTYNAAGERVRKVTERAAPAGGTPTRMKERIYLGPFEIYREFDNTGAGIDLERETLHVMDDARRVALVESRTVGDDDTAARLVRYQFANHLGTAALELDDVARVISYEEYHPFGSTAYQAMNAAIKSAAKRYRYTMKERDEETGLAYHGARYYAAWLGRWASADPLGLVAGPNVYAYCRCNPIILHDPSGMIGEGPTQPPPANIPALGQFGHVTSYSRQPRATYAIPGNRASIQTENEHVLPGAQLRLLRNNPRTGQTDYTPSSYRNDATVRVERAFALNKTAGGPTTDNVRSANLTARVAAGGGISLNQDIVLPSLENARRARDASGSVVTDQALNRGALNQLNNLFGSQTLSETAAELRTYRPSLGDRIRSGISNAGQRIGSAVQRINNPTTRAVAAAGVSAAARAASLGRAGVTVAARALIPGFEYGESVVAAGGHRVLAAQASQAVRVVSTGARAVAAAASAAPAAAAATVVAGGVAGGVVGHYVGHAVQNATGSRTAGVASGTLAGAATGAAVGAVIGSVVPVLGTAAGAVIGGAAGAIGGFIGSFW